MTNVATCSGIAQIFFNGGGGGKVHVRKNWKFVYQMSLLGVGYKYV